VEAPVNDRDLKGPAGRDVRAREAQALGRDLAAPAGSEAADPIVWPW